MKKNKILAGISALVMGATMMAGTAMSASAFCIHDEDGCVGNGGFYALWQDTNGDGVVDESDDYTAAPYGMYDGNITGVVVNSNGTYTLTLGTATYTVPIHGQPTQVQGSISAIKDSNGDDKLVNGVATLSTTETYTLYVSAMSYPVSVKFHVGPCTCQNCNC